MALWGKCSTGDKRLVPFPSAFSASRSCFEDELSASRSGRSALSVLAAMSYDAFGHHALGQQQKNNKPMITWQLAELLRSDEKREQWPSSFCLNKDPLVWVKLRP